MKIAYLADHADAIPLLAQWHHDEWRTMTPHVTVDDRMATLRSRLGHREVPTGFVAVADGTVAGMACLVAHDMDTRPLLTPWLATVLVAPQYRGRGIGSALSERVATEARALRFPHLYLMTFDKVGFYARLGWRQLEQADYHGRPATIMIRAFDK